MEGSCETLEEALWQLVLLKWQQFQTVQWHVSQDRLVGLTKNI